MNLSKILKNTFLVILLSMVVSACATKKTATTLDSQIQGNNWGLHLDLKWMMKHHRVLYQHSNSYFPIASYRVLHPHMNLVDVVLLIYDRKVYLIFVPHPRLPDPHERPDFSSE